MVTTDIWLLSYIMGLFTGVLLAIVIIISYDGKGDDE